jgi:GR25 family glycosyltransferase involved in LPS biosynthesis
MGDEINLETIQTYVINLDRRKDRWNSFLKNPTTDFFKNLQRYSAFEGKTLDVNTETRISLHTRENIKNNFRRSHYEINTLGACGASFSHIGVWKKFLETDETHCLVLEDDVYIRNSDLEKAVRLIKNIPKSFDIWILGYHGYSCVAKPYMKDSPWGIVDQFTGAHCYILNRKAAEGLLRECFPIETHIEFYMSGASRSQGLLFLMNKTLRVPQGAEIRGEEDSDTASLLLTCPLCNVPDDPYDSNVIVSIGSLFQSFSAIAALVFIGYGLVRKGGV